MTASHEGRFSRERLAAVLREICARLGLDAEGATLLRFTNNAVYRLAGDQAVVRIVGSHGLRHRVHKVVRIAGWLAEHDIPAVRLSAGVEQPIQVGAHLATVWDVVPSGGQPPRGHDLGALLGRIHRLPPPTFHLPSWDPLDDVRRRVDDAEDLDDDDRDFLLACCARLQEALADLVFPRPTAVVHGDAHLGNLISSPDGPVLCDFDSTCLGPPEWDLTPVAVGVGRFGEPPRTYREMARSYGWDVTRWAGFAVLREVRELKLITSVLPSVRSNPDVRPELMRRLDDFRRGDTHARWSRYT
ncbi:phosphotransferase family protein [Actinocrispum wychmicini]|uniref:Aminoglycoside phosphotransferase (APT) family kinase protein n=1 Tax=Actinocrispum wychmicini TaxID=1213861 RepID=A0A4R2JZ40_9PSEU|nr:aminoglycoside phosphotransferase family protein [Actinocrispum wychmicini]TCO64617.1 aminoglycoside phosphotransferase (APT) family kinase protein [Actinocrispum wychmicini]